MRKVIASMNITIDGFCDHTSMIADEEMHLHYAALLRNAGAILYGRTTYQLMEFWPPLVKNPSGTKSMDDFAVAIDGVQKIVFSRTLKTLDWKTARLATKGLKEEVLDLRQQEGREIFVGSPSLISALTNLNLIDEFQLCIHPVITGTGLQLFKNVSERIVLKLIATKTFKASGIMVHTMIPVR